MCADPPDTGPDRDLTVAPGHRPGSLPPPAPSSLPAAIGNYVILGKLGEGGMGIVYEAEQRQPKRRVALKVVRGGRLVDDMAIHLFRREAETLGRLKHPDIAAIYESGRTEDGRHFFAMELVQGETLDRHLRRRSPGPLAPGELRRRLALFRRICDAVNYAHQRGVIHRDLKPSNVVIGEAGLKVLDFGLARITDAEAGGQTVLTEVGAIRGTLPYMSPEQVRGNPYEIDLRTDVYSLGVILYEMLAGALPLETGGLSVLEAARVICEEPPPSIRKRAREVDEDLDTIARKALEKDPDRRYPSAAALSEDVERFLTRQPILAHPPSTAYQIRKLVARNRLSFSFAATVLALVAGFGVWMSVLYARAEGARLESEAVTRFLSNMLAAVDPVRHGREVTVREVLDESAGALATEFTGRPLVEAQLRATVGGVYRELGLYEESRPHLERALALREAKLGPRDPRVAASLAGMAELKLSTGDYDGARELYERSLAIREAALDHDHPDVANSLNGLGMLARDAGDFERARPLLERALAIRERTLGPDSPEVALTLNLLAIMHKETGDYAGAVSRYERALAIWEKEYGPGHLRTGQALANLAEVLRIQGDLDRARPMFARSLAIFETELGPDHPEVALSLNSNAIMLAESGDLPGARAMFERALAVNERSLGPVHRDVGQSLSNLAIVHGMMGDRAGARSLLERSVEVYRQALGPEHRLLAQQLTSLAGLYLDDGDRALAEPLLARALAIQEKPGGDPIYRATTLHQLGRVRRAAGEHGAARALFEQALLIRETQLGPEHPEAAETRKELASVR